MHMYRFVSVLIIALGLLQPSLAISSPNYYHTLEESAVKFVHKTIDTLRYSTYKMGGSHFDTSKGIYIVDCSKYVDQILQAVSPHAYMSLVNSCGVDTPNTQHYYDFFSDLSDDPYWSKVSDVENLRPGDIIVFRYKKHRRSAMRGHVMVVMDTPIRTADAYLVRVADSAPSPHSQDTRPAHVSGIGIGTLLLKVNPKTGRPAAYAWTASSLWKRNVTFAMARPIELT
jgi:hypothetical protein